VDQHEHGDRRLKGNRSRSRPVVADEFGDKRLVLAEFLQLAVPRDF
jgi:hypothetical protein